MKAQALKCSLLAAGLLGSISIARPATAAGETRSAGATSGAASVATLNEEGAALYAARDYRRAIEKFIQAYAIDADPNLLFNIARCYEELGELEAAIEKYEVFLTTPGADARGRQRARESLAVLRQNREAMAAQRASAQQGASEPEQPSRGVEASSAASEPASNAWPWLTLGGSIAFAAAGTTFYLLGASDHSQVTGADGYGDPDAVASMTRGEADALVSSGDTKKLVGGISFGVAGALAATYLVLLLTDDEPRGEAPALGFSVAPSPHGAAASLQGSF